MVGSAIYSEIHKLLELCGWFLDQLMQCIYTQQNGNPSPLLQGVYPNIWRSWISASWYNYKNNQQDALYGLIYYSKTAVHVSDDVFTYHQKH
jgi:hypothetical protein